jgi:hypothetical protein
MPTVAATASHFATRSISESRSREVEESKRRRLDGKSARNSRKS